MDQPMQQQTNQPSLFHKRASIVIKDILDQLGIDDTKIKMLSRLTETIKGFPPFVFPMMGIPGDKVTKMINDLEPLLMMANTENPYLLINQFPEEKMLYFINQVITRLEWVKDGNEKDITKYTEVTEVNESESGHSGK